MNPAVTLDDIWSNVDRNPIVADQCWHWRGRISKGVPVTTWQKRTYHPAKIMHYLEYGSRYPGTLKMDCTRGAQCVSIHHTKHAQNKKSVKIDA